MPTFLDSPDGSCVIQSGVRYGPASLPGDHTGAGSLSTLTSLPLIIFSLHGPWATSFGAMGLVCASLQRECASDSTPNARDRMRFDPPTTPTTTRIPGYPRMLENPIPKRSWSDTPLNSNRVTAPISQSLSTSF